MKFKRYFKCLILYNLIVFFLIFLFNKLGINDNVIRYVQFETTVFKFQDLLSITITILSVLVGAVITAATVLISMCDKRIIKLINRNDKSLFLVKCIKIAILSGMVSILLLAIVYSKLDFNIYIIRSTILYLSGYFLTLFTINSRLLIKVVLSVLNDAFKENDSFIVQGTFKKPKK